MSETLYLEPTILTTKDNPYDPRVDFDKWYQWDQDAGYNTLEYLARVANMTVDNDNAASDTKLELAKLEIIDNDMEDLYVLL